MDSGPCHSFSKYTPTTAIYTLSLHDALPICSASSPKGESQRWAALQSLIVLRLCSKCARSDSRSEEHTSELQSHSDLVCRLLLEKKNVLESILNWDSKFFANIGLHIARPCRL